MIRFLPYSLSTLAVCACVTGGEDDGPAPVPPGLPYLSARYRVEEGRIILPEHHDSDYYCEEDRPMVRTYLLWADTMPYAVQGTALALGITSITAPGSTSGAVFEFTYHFERRGGGKGLEGVWRIAYADFLLATGVPYEWEKEYFAQASERYRPLARLWEWDYVFHDGVLDRYLDEKVAERTKAEWEGSLYPAPQEDADSFLYDVDIRLLDKYTVEYHGRKTGETVKNTRIPLRGTYDLISDNPKHAPIHLVFRPGNAITCPYIESWFQEFLDENRKATSIAARKRSGSDVFNPEVPQIPRFGG